MLQMGRATASRGGPSLSFSWALAQLQQQLGCAGEDPSRCGGPSDARPAGSLTSLGCPTPSCTDSGAHGAGVDEQQQQQQAAARDGPVPRALSVHWADALEQHCQRPHAPLHHTQGAAPDKPCLKLQQTSFPFVEEAAALEGLMRRPRALLQLNLEQAVAQHADHHAAKKRSRLAAFGQ